MTALTNSLCHLKRKCYVKKQSSLTRMEDDARMTFLTRAFSILTIIIYLMKRLQSLSKWINTLFTWTIIHIAYIFLRLFSMRKGQKEKQQQQQQILLLKQQTQQKQKWQQIFPEHVITAYCPHISSLHFDRLPAF